MPYLPTTNDIHYVLEELLDWVGLLNLQNHGKIVSNNGRKLTQDSEWNIPYKIVKYQKYYLPDNCTPRVLIYEFNLIRVIYEFNMHILGVLQNSLRTLFKVNVITLMIH